jgi:hypothetical protein
MAPFYKSSDETDGPVKFGDASDDLHQFSGSVSISGTLTVLDVSGSGIHPNAGINIQAPQGVSDALTLGSNGAAYLKLNTTAAESGGEMVELSKHMMLMDDTKLYFGENGDASIEFDEDGRNRLVLSGANEGIMVSGSVYFQNMAAGTGDGATSYLAVSADKKLVLTASAGGGGGGGGSPGGSDTQMQYNNNGSFGGISVFTWDDTDLKVADDTKLYFGTHGDAHIEYDENGTDELIVSGAAGGIDIQAPQGVSDALTLSSNGESYLTFNTTPEETGGEMLELNKPMIVMDDIKLYFGNTGDAYIEYDENGTDELVVSGAAGGIDIMAPQSVSDGLTLSSNGDAYLTLNTTAPESGGEMIEIQKSMMVYDDTKLYFGSGGDAYIEYDEDDTDELIVSGAAGGIDIQTPQGVSDALTLSSNGESYLTLNTTAVESGGEMVELSKPMLVADDTKIYFGSQGETYIMYDESGRDALQISGSGRGTEISGTVRFSLPYNTATGLEINQHATKMLVVDTTDGQEAIQFHQTTLVRDDVKLYFGNTGDAYIEYDEDGTDELIVSGAAGGIDIMAPQGVSDGLTLSSNGDAYLTLNTTAAESGGEMVELSKHMLVADDTKIYFGSTGDAYIEYDEDGTDELVVSGAAGGIDIMAPQGVADGLTLSSNGDAYLTLNTTAVESGGEMVELSKHMLVADDTKVYFGSQGESSLEYDENGQDKFILSGAASGIIITGSTHFSNTSHVVFGNPASLVNDTGGGEVVHFGTSSGPLHQGALYYLNFEGGWDSASADVTGSGNDALLGISLGTRANSHGMLTRGFFDANSYYKHSFLKGKAVYVESGSHSTGYAGMSGAAPTATNSYVRIVGYATDTANVIYFNPGTNWVELS